MAQEWPTISVRAMTVTHGKTARIVSKSILDVFWRDMDKAKQPGRPTKSERCPETFRNHRCSKEQGHNGKHLSLDDCWVQWTDAGKKRVEREEAQK